MRTEEFIIIVILIFFILFFLNKNKNENYDELSINYEKEDSNKICFDKNKLYGNYYNDSKPDFNLIKPVQKDDNLIKPVQKDDNLIKPVQKDDNLIKPVQKDDNLCMCSAVYDPVNCNGRIYDNLCAARCAKENLSKCSSKTWNIIDNNNLDYNINSLITEES
jgi:hypothetical protein